MLLAGSGPPLPRATRTGVQLKEIAVNPLLASLLFLSFFPPLQPSSYTLLHSPFSLTAWLLQPEKPEVKGKSETHPFKTQMVSSLDNTLHQPQKTAELRGAGGILTAKGRGEIPWKEHLIHGPHGAQGFIEKLPENGTRVLERSPTCP